MGESMVEHQVESQRFVTLVDGHRAVLTYTLAGEVMVTNHTGVPRPIEGRGVGGRLAHAALSHARERGLRVLPACSFVAHYIHKHPEWADLLEAS
jgi:predicted GNAT family acetyltransferase